MEIPVASVPASSDSTDAQAAAMIADMKANLTDEKAPIAKRMRTLFMLRQIGTKDAIDALAAGQMLSPHAVPHLNRMLQDTKYNPIVRHEAAEGLGAIGMEESIELLQKYLTDPAVEVRETCELALARINYNRNMKNKASESKEADYETVYNTTDPAPALKETSTPILKDILLDTSRSLFERYRAMFALRNKGDTGAVEALGAGFDDTSSALFRHEIAYVMGQLQHPASAPFLIKALENTKDHAMVRHEAAEALGSLGNPEYNPVLEKFRSDPDLIVSQSCDVALDICDYWNEEPEEETPEPAAGDSGARTD